MRALFSPRVLEKRTGCTFHGLTLEPAEPYLDHHRPGGRPLLGTAMGLEAMSAVAHAIVTDAPLLLTDIVVGVACIVDGAGGQEAEIEIRALAGGPASSCTVSSRRSDGGRSVHFSATVAPASAPAIWPAASRPQGSAVSAAQIYDHFFHGPAYRVVRYAHWQGEQLQAVMAHPLLALRSGGPCRTASAPRAIEFAMQAAGLLLLARTGEMRVPAAIRAVFIADGDERRLPAACRACAVHRDDDTVDIQVTTADGAVVAQVEGYRTAPLPFPDSMESRNRLLAALRIRSSDYAVDSLLSPRGARSIAGRRGPSPGPDGR